MKNTFTFNEDQFNRLFPFYLLVDKEMEIVSCGKSLKKLFPGYSKRNFKKTFVLNRPQIEHYNFQTFLSISNQLIFLKFITSSEFILRGQVEYLKEVDCLLFLLSPWFDSVEKVLENNLTVNDFALHESKFDLLHVLKAHEITTHDMKELLIQQKKQKEELQKLSLIVEDSVNAVVVTNSKGVTEWVNKGFTNLTGYTKDEVVGKKPGHVLQGRETSKETVLYLRDKIKNEQPFVCEILNYHKNGTPYWVRITGQPLFGKEGKVVQFFAFEENITEEKLVKEKLKESEKRLATLILNLQTGILLEDENRKVLLSNRQFCNLFSIPVDPENLKGTDCRNAAEQSKALFKNPEEFVRRINQLTKEKKIAMGDELEMIDGRILERDFIPIYDDQNNYKGHLWKYLDITFRKNYQKNLKAQKEKYSNIIANMHLGLVEANHNNEVLYVNQSFVDMIGYSREELIGKDITELIQADAQDLVKQQIQKRRQGIADSYELKIKIKNGEERYWINSAAPNYNEQGEIIGTIAIQLDITERKRLENEREKLLESLENQNERLNEYAHVVSHDLKSPLRNISALVSWTKEDFAGRIGKESLTNLNHIQNKIEKMDHLIGNILKYSSIESSSVVNKQLDLDVLVRDIIDMIYIPDHISVSVKRKLPTIVADQTRIQQLFQNLIANAVNYIDKPKGIVEVDFEVNTTHYVFKIKDNGIGIARENFEKIFNVFSSLGNHERSTGIGLSIVKKVVRFYEGKIWLESEVGKGTTFFFSIKQLK